MIHVRGPRILVALPEPDSNEVTTASGLVLMRDPDLAKIPTRGIVVQLGDKRGAVDLEDVRTELYNCCLRDTILTELDWAAIDDALRTLEPAGFDVAVGDCVLFPLSAGEEVRVDGRDFVILHESDVLGVVEPLQKETAA